VTAAEESCNGELKCLPYAAVSYMSFALRPNSALKTLSMTRKGLPFAWSWSTDNVERYSRGSCCRVATNWLALMYIPLFVSQSHQDAVAVRLCSCRGRVAMREHHCLENDSASCKDLEANQVDTLQAVFPSRLLQRAVGSAHFLHSVIEWHAILWLAQLDRPDRVPYGAQLVVHTVKGELQAPGNGVQEHALCRCQQPLGDLSQTALAS